MSDKLTGDRKVNEAPVPAGRAVLSKSLHSQAIDALLEAITIATAQAYKMLTVNATIAREYAATAAELSHAYRTLVG